MKRSLCRWVALNINVVLVTVSALQPVLAKEISRSGSLAKIIDSFDRMPPAMKYLPYGREKASVQEGYGVYYDAAEVRLARVTVSRTDKALRIQYHLLRLYDWGNWLSIRREFAAPMDLSTYDGLELQLKVEVPSDALLRITLCDVESHKKVRRGSDEMWWYNFSAGVLKASPGKWVTLRAPFKDFYLSYGEGTRQNDGRKDFSKVIAFEINLISKPGEQPSGSLVVNSLSARRGLGRSLMLSPRVAGAYRDWGQPVEQRHAISKGSAAYSLRLFQGRAEIVRGFLVHICNVPKASLSAKGYGEDRPLASNDIPEGRAMNRRVQFARSEEH